MNVPVFTLELLFRGDSGQKSHWESVAKELQGGRARILKIQSKIGEPLTTVNVLTITYEAPVPIKYNRE